MSAYRLYRLTNAGRVTSTTELPCGVDGEAIAAADAVDDGRRMELWDGARIVKVFNPGAARADVVTPAQR